VLGLRATRALQLNQGFAAEGNGHAA